MVVKDDAKKIDVRKLDGTKSRNLDLDEAVFGVQPNVPVMHQVVVAQLAAARSGTQSTKTRSEVAGGGKKPYRQKGTGRARQGTISAPHYTGGGVAMGPKPRNYAQRTPKKMVQLALRSALSDRANEGKVVVVENFNWTKPRTKDAMAVLDALGVGDDRVLMVLSRDDEMAYLSFRNLAHVQLLLAGELNAYDVLCNDWIVFTESTVPSSTNKVPAQVSSSPVEITASKSPTKGSDE